MPRSPIRWLAAAACLATCWWYAALYQSHVSVGLKTGIVVDYFPTWNAGRAILHGIDPYSDEITAENEVAANGATAAQLHTNFRQRFSYPVFAVFPLLPLSVLAWPVANTIAFLLFATLLALCSFLLRGILNQKTLLYSAALLAFYPAIYDLQSRQPTVPFFTLALAGLWALRSNHERTAGVLFAFSLAKPQVAIPIILPALLFSMSDRQRHRSFRSFFGALVMSLLGLAFAGEIVAQGWVREWTSAVGSYAGYNRPSLLVSYFGPTSGLVVSVLVAVGLVVYLWMNRRGELLAQVSISVTVFSFLFPYQPYNMIVLLVPCVWILDSPEQFGRAGMGAQMSAAGVRVALAGVFLGNLVGVFLWGTQPIIAAALPGVTTTVLLFCLTVACAAYVVIALASPTRGPLSAHVCNEMTVDVRQE